MSNIIQTEQDFLSFIQGHTLANGNLSIDTVARCCAVDTNLQGYGELLALNSNYSPLKVYLGLGSKRVTELTPEQCLRAIAYFGTQPPYANNMTCRMLYARFIKGGLSGEKYWQALLLKLGNKVEIPTALGVVDILTDTHVVEVKTVTSAHMALGQVLAYSHALNRPLMPAVVCFGDAPPDKLALLAELFAVNSVEFYHLTDPGDCLSFISQQINSTPSIWKVSDALKAQWVQAHTY